MMCPLSPDQPDRHRHRLSGPIASDRLRLLLYEGKTAMAAEEDINQHNARRKRRGRREEAPTIAVAMDGTFLTEQQQSKEEKEDDDHLLLLLLTMMVGIKHALEWENNIKDLIRYKC